MFKAAQTNDIHGSSISVVYIKQKWLHPNGQNMALGKI